MIFIRRIIARVIATGIDSRAIAVVDYMFQDGDDFFFMDGDNYLFQQEL